MRASPEPPEPPESPGQPDPAGRPEPAGPPEPSGLSDPSGTPEPSGPPQPSGSSADDRAIGDDERLVDTEEAPTRALPTLRVIALVFVGGVVGVALRIGVLAVVPDAVVAVLATNLVGAFALGLLLEAVPERGRASELRPLVGTGLLGGFTTYSSFAVDTLALGGWLAAGYAAASIAGGLLAAAAGVVTGRALSRRSMKRRTT